MKQQGLVMVFALLVLMSLTVLGVASVSSSLMQNKMAISMEKSSLAFDAAESAIAGVVFESEDEVILTNPLKADPLSQARQGNTIDLANQQLSCFNDVDWTNRSMTQAGLAIDTVHNAVGIYNDNPEIVSWSRTAFVRERACKGSSNVISGSNISCHVFVIKGCGRVAGANFAVANTLSASVFAPASQ